jgi:hypothetical protein
MRVSTIPVAPYQFPMERRNRVQSEMNRVQPEMNRVQPEMKRNNVIKVHLGMKSVSLIYL